MGKSVMFAKVSAFGLAGMGCLFPAPVSATPAMYYNYRPLRITPSGCVSQARATARAVGLKNVGDYKLGSGGITSTARASIHCTTLPRSGPCNRDGASVMFIVASDRSGDDAQALLRQIDANFGDPILFDCN
jgi:hypothetical protein